MRPVVLVLVLVLWVQVLFSSSVQLGPCRVALTSAGLRVCLQNHPDHRAICYVDHTLRAAVSRLPVPIVHINRI